MKIRVALLEDLIRRQPRLRGPRGYVVAYSGGLDSTVLLDLLRRTLPRVDGAGLRSIHVNHNLHEQARQWQQHCAGVAASFGVRHQTLEVDALASPGQSPEATAREVRYQALFGQLSPGEVLVTAHTADDQAETVLLQLLRGAGVAGLAAMPALAEAGTAMHWRPLLSVQRQDLRQYAARYQLAWIEDSSNLEQRYDRNYLRQQVIPLLQARWPGLTRTLGRSARHAAAAMRLAAQFAERDLQSLVDTGQRMDLHGLRQLSPERRNNVLRAWLNRLGLPTPHETVLEHGVAALLSGRNDSLALASWPGAELRRYRQRLYAMATLPAAPDNFGSWLTPTDVMQLPAGCGRLRLHTSDDGPRLQQPQIDKLRVGFRHGGERLRITPGGRTRTLRNLLQEAGVVPWMRARIPLLYQADQLVAVGDLWIASHCSAQNDETGLKIEWSDHPPLY